MKKLRINAEMNRKQSEYSPNECIVEKVISTNAKALIENHQSTYSQKALRTLFEYTANDVVDQLRSKNTQYIEMDKFLEEPMLKSVLTAYIGEIIAQRDDVVECNFANTVIQAKLSPIQEIRFYCPLVIQETNGHGEYEEISACDAVSYATNINNYIEGFMDQSEKERGLMHWYGENNSINDKVQSVFMSVEERDQELYGVLTAKICGNLTNSEMQEFMSYCTGQLSDGWGESFEQMEIKTCDGDIYVSFWNNSNDYFLMPESEVFNTEKQVELQEDIDMSDLTM